MRRPEVEFPTYEFANDPLPPTPVGPQPDPSAYRPFDEVRFGDNTVRVTARVDQRTPWRATGNTDYDHFLAAVSRTFDGQGESPLARNARRLYDILRAAGLSRFAVAILWHEKKNDTWRDTPVPVWLHNPFSVKDRNGPGGWASYETYPAAAIAWVELVGRAIYPQQGSIRNFIEIYAPSSENDVDRYLAVIEREINALPLEDAQPAPPKGKPIKVVGFDPPLFVPSDLAFEVVLTPRGSHRPGEEMNPQGVTQHETGNRNEKTGARWHSLWQDNCTINHPNGPIGVHFYVDDKIVIQKIPVNETSIHAGYQANRSHISVELCVNEDRDWQRAERNAAVFVAALIRDGLKRRVDALTKHNSWSPGLDCPKILNLEKRWPTFQQTVGRLIEEGVGPDETFPGLPASMPPDVFRALFPDANPNGPITKFYIDYCVNQLPDGQWPRFNGVTTLGNGNRWWDFNPLHIFSDPQGKLWVVV